MQKTTYLKYHTVLAEVTSLSEFFGEVTYCQMLRQ